MIESQADIKKIKKYLPFRYSKELQKRVLDRTGKKYSLNYIAMCLADPPVRHNADVLHEAAMWADEEKKKLEAIATILEAL